MANFEIMHKYGDDKIVYVKLLQSCILVEELELLINQHKINQNNNNNNNNKSTSNNLPVMLTGDFNSLPDSGVYELLHHGKLPPHHSDFNNHNYGKYSEKGMELPLCLKGFQSVYRTTTGEPVFTNYTDSFFGTLDYIFYTSDMLIPKKVLAPVEVNIAEQLGALPNAYMCSDHIALVAEFEFNVEKKI